MNETIKQKMDRLGFAIRAGKMTVNDARRECGLVPLEIETADSLLIQIDGEVGRADGSRIGEPGQGEKGHAEAFADRGDFS